MDPAWHTGKFVVSIVKGLFKMKTMNKAWLIWFIASIFYAYQYILRVMPSIMLTDIMQKFHLDSATFGQFSGVYYLGYSLMHLPMGIALDRFGPRYVMTACLLMMSVGLLPLVYTDEWIYPIIGRVIIGMGSSAAILGAFKIIRMSFNEGRFTRMLSLCVTIGLIGAIYGGGPVSHLSALYGYQNVIKSFAVLGLILAAITFVTIPDLKTAEKTRVLSDLIGVLSQHKVIVLCCLAGLMVGPMEGFADVWGAEFLKRVYQINPTTANYLPSMIFIGMCFGGPVLSAIAEKSGYYLETIAGAGVVMFAMFTLLLTTPLTEPMIAVGFTLVGVCSAYQILAIYKASTYVPDHVAGLTTAVANMIIMGFGYAFHVSIGGMIDANHNTPLAFTYGIAIIPFTLAIGALGFFILAWHEKRVSHLN